jgi:transcriptional regulator with XRE-family HTH domain
MNIPFGQDLKQARRAQSLTHQALAKLLKISDGMLSQYETGKKFPSSAILEKLCEVTKLDFDTAYLKILSEKDPDYFSKPNIHYVYGPAKQPRDVIELDRRAENPKTLPNLISSLVFDLAGGFLEPIAAKGQKIIVSYSAPPTSGDVIFLNLELTLFADKNFTATPRAREVGRFLLDNEQMEDGNNLDSNQTVVGRMVSDAKDKIVVAGIRKERPQLIIPKKEIKKIARLMGVLF